MFRDTVHLLTSCLCVALSLLLLVRANPSGSLTTGERGERVHTSSAPACLASTPAPPRLRPLCLPAPLCSPPRLAAAAAGVTRCPQHCSPPTRHATPPPPRRKVHPLGGAREAGTGPDPPLQAAHPRPAPLHPQHCHWQEQPQPRPRQRRWVASPARARARARPGPPRASSRPHARRAPPRSAAPSASPRWQPDGNMRVSRAGGRALLARRAGGGSGSECASVSGCATCGAVEWHRTVHAPLPAAASPRRAPPLPARHRPSALGGRGA